MVVKSEREEERAGRPRTNCPRRPAVSGRCAGLRPASVRHDRQDRRRVQ